MKILNQLAIDNLKLNKKRTIVTLIGIILSCALICGVATLVTSFQNTLIEETKLRVGNFHTIFKNVSQEESKYITSNVKITDYMKIGVLGYAKFDQLQDELKPYLYLIQMDEKALANTGVEILQGRLPENENEIVIPEHLIRVGKVNLKIGDKLSLSVGKRLNDNNEELTQNNPNFEFVDDEEVLIPETLKVENTKEYEVVGVCGKLTAESYYAPGYTVLTYMKEEPEKVNIAVLYNKIQDTYKNTEQILKALSNENSYDVSYNTDLLMYSGVSNNDNTNTTIYLLSAIIIAIIIFTSVFVIRNSFYISITERLKEYGMLASIGATSKQIKRSVFFEGAILGIIAIPLGILGGLFAIKILILVLNGIVGQFLNDMLIIYHVSIGAVIISAILSSITILLSCYFPARRASKINPIDAIRSSQDINIKGKKLKISKITSKLFGIEGEVAIKNLKRSRKKYRTTIFSIFISIVIFIALSSFIEYGFKVGSSYFDKIEYDISVNHPSDGKEALDFYDKVKKLDHVGNYSIQKIAMQTFDAQKYAKKEAMEQFLSYQSVDEKTKEPLKSSALIYITALGEEEYQRYIEKLGGNPKDFEGKGILLNKTVRYMDDKLKEVEFLNIQEGENIICTNLPHASHNKDQDKRKELSIEIAKITDVFPMSINSNHLYEAPFIIVSDSFMNQLEYQVREMTIQSENPNKLEEDIKKLSNFTTYQIYNQESDRKANDAMVLVIQILLYGFITVISLIGITNIYNTITTNMALRTREFAILKSIGMTHKEFRKMINFESIFYGLKALLYGIPVGLMLSYGIYLSIDNMYESSYHLPWQAIILSIVFVLVMVWSTMRYAVKKAEKDNIIDTIRNENI